MAETSTVPKPLEGTTTVDDKMTFEPGRLSYASARRLAVSIVDTVAPRLGADATVVIAGDAFLADLGNLGSARLQLEMLAEDYRRVAGSLGAAPATRPAAVGTAVAATAVVPAVTAGLQSALGLVSLLRENVEFKGVETKVDPRAFEIALAAQLAEHRVKAYVPDLMAVRSPLATPASFRALLTSVQSERQSAWNAIGPHLADLATADAELDRASRSGTPAQVATLSSKVLKLRRSIEPLTEMLKHAEKRLTDLQAQWDKTSETTGLSMLTRLLRAEAIEAMTPKYLHAAVVLAGGHHRVSRHLFRMLFMGDGVSAMGGVVVRWALLEPDGRVVVGDVVAARQAASFPNTFLKFFDAY